MLSMIARSLILKMAPLCYEPLTLDKQEVEGKVFYKHYF